MKIVDVYGIGKFGLSFEIFPPKTETGESQLFAALEALMAHRPSFVSCTYGAAGSTQDKTLELTTRIGKIFGVTTAAHRTCVGSTVEEIRQWLKEAVDLGIENIVALRGDPPKGQVEFKKSEGGLAYANELVTLIRQEFPHLSIAVAGYPETHQEAPSPAVDLANLKRKVKAGADAVLTQLFYDNRDFFEFRRRYEEAGITVPLIPGILPVVNLDQIQRITSMCGATIPVSFLAELEANRDDPDGQASVGVRYAIRQCRELLDAGIPGLHFYLLNKSEATFQILQALKLSR
ncbi:methylenetetrahydrofolate reductase [NAD(P)H] [Candidatus Methylomirabilis sp.]|uniref:methylenetetrahydrofolate reductase [NAD(P)H] n=1 Tax=Candidatus Methylomirabilis sp. TaxID=2032687 RepID=UPI002A5DC09A|nr:methylenetetrahydrofolate reductase [NAD(P)H] [Candidatus Methylomirabilis sp.]